MQPHQERVVVEQSELQDKISKLATFQEGTLFKTLAEDEKERLRRQYRYMLLYSDVLIERIKAF
jgi:Ni,Fe-hydrogenase III component G